MEVTDPRLVDRVEGTFGGILCIRLFSVSPDQTFSLRYVPVLTANTLTYLLIFLGGFLAFAHVARYLTPHTDVGRIVSEKFAWACLVLFPSAVFYEIVFVEVASYDAFLWANFATFFAAGAWAVILIWFEMFLYDRPITRRLSGLVLKRARRAFADGDMPAYIRMLSPALGIPKQ